MPATRINKYLSENGYCSRREADRLIEAGRVFINDGRASLGDKVSDNDTVRVEGRDKRYAPKKIYLLLNKPAGVIVTTDRTKKDNVIDFVGYDERLFPVGRIDVKTEGLLLLTNDGTLSNRLMHPKFEHEKEYLVQVDHPLEMSAIKQMQAGINLDDGMTLPAKVRKLDDRRFAIILKEGRNRQIRRMCEAVGYRVLTLTRTRMLTLRMPSNYPVGNWRHLTEAEVQELKKALGMK